jgi:general secretion pathway protein E
MASDIAVDFVEHLRRKHALANHAALAKNESGQRPEAALRKLWELSELPVAEFADEVAGFHRLPRVGLPELLAAPALTKQFSRRFLREMTLFPYRGADGRSVVALADPGDSAAIRATQIVLGDDVELRVGSFDDIETALSERLGEDAASTLAGDGGAQASVRDDDIDSLRDLASGAPVVRAVNDLFDKAVELRASDIHIEPFRSQLIVRLRVDGMLRQIPAPAGAVPQALISRIKILAGLNIAERRLPQDGAARLRLARSDIDIRVAIMPTQYGESAVIRLLPRERGVLSIDKLGCSPSDEAALQRLLRLPHGMIVVTGPTGSGKTTTLAALLSILNEPTRKILTIEDPVEYEIAGINQSQVKPAIGLTFAAALRAFVRQDPDVIMVGEVRDAETAHIAIHAALTGHLVLTTLHTENAAAAVPRLVDLGVEGFLLRSTLRAVIAQRLVRQLCDRCKAPRRLTAAELTADPRLRALGLDVGDTVHDRTGCERCAGTGYRGRLGVFEILQITDEVRSLIGARADSNAIDAAAIRAGMTTMVADGLAKCRAGVTSAAELLRVTTVR